MLDVKPGDDVFVVEPGGRGGTTRYPAVVASVRRALFTVKCDNTRFSGDYRLDTGHENGGCTNGYGPPYVITAEEAALADRHKRAASTLKQAGITFDYSRVRVWPIELLEELAAVVERWRPTPNGGQS